MKIVREVNGKMVEFELTDKEASAAFYEKQQDYDAYGVKYFIEQYNEEVFEDEYGVPLGAALKAAKDIAAILRNRIDNYDYNWNDAVTGAINEWVFGNVK